MIRLLHSATAVSALAVWVFTALSVSAAPLQPGRLVGSVRSCSEVIYACFSHDASRPSSTWFVGAVSWGRTGVRLTFSCHLRLTITAM